MGRIAGLIADALAVLRLALEIGSIGRPRSGGRPDLGARGLPDPPPPAGPPLAGVVGAEGPPLAEPPDPRVP